ncbi:unnamed protein product [Agarophyton chilense]
MWGRTTAARAVSASVQLSSSHLPLGATLTLSTNRLARLAPSSTLLRCSDASILATAATHSYLTIDFRSKAAAVGVIPLTWTRREQQPALRETITARLIDRSLRPVSPPAHICVNVFGTRRESDPPLDALAVNVAAAATAGLPNWNGPIAAARVSYVGGRFIPFASESVASEALLSTFVAINEKQRVLCLSIQGANVHDSVVSDSIVEAIQAAAPIIQLQKDYHEMLLDLREREGFSSFPRQEPQQQQPPQEAHLLVPDEVIMGQIQQYATEIYGKAFIQCRDHPGKAHRAHILTIAQQQILNQYQSYSLPHVLRGADIAAREAFRFMIFSDGLRLDGRSPGQVRPLRAEAAVLPGDVHGSALFERGDTQVLAHATIGLLARAAKVEEYIDGADHRPFFVHYSFPSYATGEPGRPTSYSSRREIGHGMLAEDALAPVLGPCSYALRVSAEVLSSDGSSSMAAVCAGSMALRDAGAPITQDVAGVAMGLVTNGDQEIILTDILGAEDHFGEMDMKVTGTKEGITACQLDTKNPEGLSQQTLSKALSKARVAHEHILDHMHGQETRSMPKHAPRVAEIPVEANGARTLLRDRASILKEIEEQTDSKLWYDQRKQVVSVEAPNEGAAQLACKLVGEAAGDLEVGRKVNATVIEVRQSFAVVQIDNGVQGVLHVSKMMVNPVAGGERFPDARRIVAKGDKLEAVVVEANQVRGVLRFGLTKLPERASRLVSGVDDVLAAVALSVNSQQAKG